MHRTFAWLFSCAALSAAETSLTLLSPTEHAVVQRQSANSGRVEVNGQVQGEGAAVEIRCDGGAWQSLKTFPAEGKPGTLGFAATVNLSKGLHTLEARAVQGDQPLGSAASVHFGVGEVFVVTGQSNSANHGAGKTKATSDQVFSLTPKGVWQPCADPQPGASGNGGSILPALGDELQKRLGVPIGFIPCGIGATSVREWLPAGIPFPNPPTIVSRVKKTADGAWEADGKAYAMLAARMRSVPSFRAVLWHQGESDANQKDTTRTLSGKLYAEYLTKLIAASAKDSQRPAPWFVAQVSYHGPKDVGSDDIRDAQASLWKNGVALEGPDSDALRGELRDQGGNGVHFSAEGLKAHAHVWAEKLVPWIQAQH
jgi:hypothetical protein